MAKSADAFRTISEVAEWLEVPAHVLRFWESKFTQVKPVKRAGGRRYYRPDDMRLLGGIKKLLHDDGLTIKGAQRLLRENGVAHVAALSQPLDAEAPMTLDAMPGTPAPDSAGNVVEFARGAGRGTDDDTPGSADADAAGEAVGTTESGRMGATGDSATKPDSPAPDAETADTGTSPHDSAPDRNAEAVTGDRQASVPTDDVTGGAQTPAGNEDQKPEPKETAATGGDATPEAVVDGETPGAKPGAKVEDAQPAPLATDRGASPDMPPLDNEPDHDGLRPQDAAQSPEPPAVPELPADPGDDAPAPPGLLSALAGRPRPLPDASHKALGAQLERLQSLRARLSEATSDAASSAGPGPSAAPPEGG